MENIRIFVLYMADERYIQVILPLKLEWEPFYTIPDGMEVKVGDRVRVFFAGAFYVACVSEIGTTPSPDIKRILPIELVEKDLPPIFVEEIRFWRAIAQYYLCSVGEVYKAAYPAMKHHKSRLAIPECLPPSSKPQLTQAQEEAIKIIRTGFQSGKTVLLNDESGSSRTDLYINLAAETLQKGESVLYLVPEIILSSQLQERIAKTLPSVLVYHSHLTPGKRKQVAETVRKGEATIVLGTRSALFLPHHRLGLIIVDEEHDPSYKQDAPAPRYHARESAIMLAMIHRANVLLGSITPSLESIYNAECGRFVPVSIPSNEIAVSATEIEIIDTGAEWRKKGMAGSFSLKLLSQMKEVLDRGEQVLLLGPRRYYEQGKKLEDEVLEYFPNARVANLDVGTQTDLAETLQAFSEGEFDILMGSIIVSRGVSCKNLSLVAMVGLDSILARQDFRADERAYQLLVQFRGLCHRFVIQTREARHPVFVKLEQGESPVRQMLQERSQFGFPPFTRLIRIQIKDKSEQRLEYHSKQLANSLNQFKPLSGCLTGPYTPGIGKQFEEYVREIRVVLPRDKALTERKTVLARSVGKYETDNKYIGHIVLDVDPV